jgi:flagellar biosynthesis anti-sigma factor FlgM
VKVTNKLGQGLQNIDASKTAKTKTDAKVSEQKSSLASKLGDTAKVNVSSRAQDMAKAKEIASKGLDTVDEAKVARLQKLIDEGKYSVDSQAIADRLVDEHLNMGE